jgi:hypothetical protein
MEDAAGGACNTHVEIRSEYTAFGRESEQKGYFRDIDVNEG